MSHHIKDRVMRRTVNTPTSEREKHSKKSHMGLTFDHSSLLFLDDDSKIHKIPKHQLEFNETTELPKHEHKISHHAPPILRNKSEHLQNSRSDLTSPRSDLLTPYESIKMIHAERKKSRRDSHQYLIFAHAQRRNARGSIRKISEIYHKRSVVERPSENIQERVQSASQGLAPPLLRFRSAARTVLAILRAARNSRMEGKKSEEKLLSIAHYQEEVLNSRRCNYGDGLSFDPMQYRAIRDYSMSNEPKAILSMSPDQRSTEQIQVALLSLQNCVDAFCEFPIRMQRSLITSGWYEHFEKKRVIIRQGHKADNFYLILSGEAVVTIVENASSNPATVAMLGKGNSFGELAIMRGGRRAATVTCKSDVELLAVSRDDFVNIFMFSECKQEPEHIAYLRQVDALQTWPIHKLPWTDPKICLFTYFRRGTLMCRDLEHSEWIYIIKSGSCRVLTTLSSTSPQLPVRKTAKQRLNLLEQPGANNSGSVESVTSLFTQGSRTSGSHFVSSRGTVTSSLPPLQRNKTCTEEELLRRHQMQLDEISKEAEAIKLMQGRALKKQLPQDMKQDLFVELTKLGPKSTFGIEPFAFGVMDTRRCISLVSDGAEAILINRKFFEQNSSEKCWRRMRGLLQPYPTEESMQEKLQVQCNWDAFKRHAFHPNRDTFTTRIVV